MMPGLKPETLLVSAGRPEGQGQPLNVPLVPASNRVLGAGPVYAREDGTPTWEALEAIMGQLEGGKDLTVSAGNNSRTDWLSESSDANRV
jgi:cystathionine gamma-synthase